jgi:hypothetical protein
LRSSHPAASLTGPPMPRGNEVRIAESHLSEY